MARARPRSGLSAFVGSRIVGRGEIPFLHAYADNAAAIRLYEELGFTAGLADSGAMSVEATIAGEAMRPPSPVHLKAWFDGAGNLQSSWVRRSRYGWSWLDGVDAPLGSSMELYRVTVAGTASVLEAETAVPQIEISLAQLSEIGSGDAMITVVQIGDLAPSRAASLPITIN